MGQLAFLKAFILVAIPIDINDNRRHVHVYRKGSRHLRSVAKIWIESGNDQITKTFRGEKPQPKNIET